MGPSGTRLPNSLPPSPDMCPQDSQPTPHQRGPVIAMQHQDEVCDGQHPCRVGEGYRGISLGACGGRQVEGARLPSPTLPVF